NSHTHSGPYNLQSMKNRMCRADSWRCAACEKHPDISGIMARLVKTAGEDIRRGTGWPMKLLDRYIIRHFLINFIILLVVLMVLFITIDMLSDLDEFLKAGPALVKT